MRLEPISWDADSKLTPTGYRPRMRINPFIMMDELSRSNAAVSRFGRDLCRDLASSVCHFGQEYMVAMRYHITHQRDINDITLEGDWMKVFREYIKSRIEKTTVCDIFENIFLLFDKYVIVVFHKRASRSTKFLFRYIIGFMCTSGFSVSLSLSLFLYVYASKAIERINQSNQMHFLPFLFS